MGWLKCENMSKRTAVLVATFIFLCSLHLWIYASLPAARKEAGWPNSVLHNWHEYGYWHLNGQLVANPGGLDAGEKPFVYPGHRPLLLLPPYWLKELPGITGGNGLLYDFVMVLAMFVGLTQLFGTGARGVLLASIACLSPGFIANVVTIDMTSYPAAVGLAVLPFAAARLADGGGKPARQVLPMAVLLLFMLLNWSTLFSLFVAAVYLCARRPAQWKNLVVYLGAAALVGLGVFAVSIMSKHAGGATTGDFWNAYLWGPGGYDGNGMTLGKALVRILGVNVIAWLPLAVGGLVLWLRNGPGERWWLAPLPLAAAVFAVFVMRNYHAHHPRGTLSIIGLGLLFSLELLIAPRTDSKRAWPAIGVATATAFCLFYCTIWLAFDAFNARDFNPLFALIEQNTPRHSLIVVTDGLTPGGELKPEPFSGMVDRKCLSAADWENRRDEMVRGGKEVFFLTHGSPPPGSRVVAQSQCLPQWTDRFVTPLFDFYRSKISRRAAGDRKTYFDQYRLYKL